MPFRKRALIPEDDPTSIGNLLCQAKLCSESQLRDALAIKRQHEDQYLGETLVKMGVITKDMLEVILEKQATLRSSGAKKAMRSARTAARTTLALSGSLEALNAIALQALQKLKT